MATPDELQKLEPADLESYNIILEASGQQAADAFLFNKLERYEEIRAAQDVQMQQEKIKLAEQQGVEPPPATLPSGIRALTEEEQRQFRESVQRRLQGTVSPSMPAITDPGRVLMPELTPEQREAEIVTQRRERIPSNQQIQAEVDDTYANIVQGFANQGYPTEQTLFNNITQVLLLEWEGNNGPLSERPEAEQIVIENALLQEAQKELRKSSIETAESKARFYLEGEFGVGRPRQAGSPYNLYPTPRVIPSAIDPTGNIGGELQRAPETVRKMSGVEAIIESLKPQVIMTSTEMKEQEYQKKMQTMQYYSDLERRAKRDIPDFDQYSKTEKSFVLDEMALADYDQIYEDNLARAREMFKGRVDFTDAMKLTDSAKTAATIATRQMFEQSVPETVETAYLRKKFYEKYGSLATLDPILMLDDAGKIAVDLFMDAVTEPRYGELTESTGMTMIRNLNLPFRLVLNPLEEAFVEGKKDILGTGINFGLVNTDPATIDQPAKEVGMSGYYIDPVTGEEKQSFYDVPSYDLTEEVTGFFPTIDAYLKEVAIENAKGYGTGNAVSNYAKTPGGKDASFVGGTIVEIIMPWGTMAKMAQKGATGFGTIGKLGRGLNIGADVAAVTAEGAKSGAPNIASAAAKLKPTESVGLLSRTATVNNKIAYDVARQMEAVDAARQYSAFVADGNMAGAQAIAQRMDADKVQYAVFESFIPQNMRPQIIDDLAEEMAIKFEPRSLLPDNSFLDDLERAQFDDLFNESLQYGSSPQKAMDDAIEAFNEMFRTPDQQQLAPFTGSPDDIIPGITVSARAEDLMREASEYVGELEDFMQGVAMQDTVYGDAAKVILREGRADLGMPQELVDQLMETGIPIGSRSGASLEQIVEAPAQRLATKYNLDEFIALTDRVSIRAPQFNKYSKKFYDDVEKTLLDPDVPVRLDEEFFGGKTYRRDPVLRQIVETAEQGRGKGPSNEFLALSPEDQTFVLNRWTEAWWRRQLAEAGQRGDIFQVTTVEGKAGLRAPEVRADVGGYTVVPPTAIGLTGDVTTEYANLITGATRRAISAVSPASVGRKMRLTTPTLTSQERLVATEGARAAKDAVTALDRSLPQAVSRWGSIMGEGAPDANTAALRTLRAMYVYSLKADPTDVLTMSDDAVRKIAESQTVIPRNAVIDIMQTTFPDMVADDVAKLLQIIPEEGFTDIVQVQGLATQLQGIPRLAQNARVNKIKGGVLVPDIESSMLALTANNAAKMRVANNVQRTLGPLALPAPLRGKLAQEEALSLALDINSGKISLQEIEAAMLGNIEYRPGQDISRRIDTSSQLGSRLAKLEDDYVTYYQKIYEDALIEINMRENPGVPVSPQQLQEIRRSASNIASIQAQINIVDDLADISNALRVKGLELGIPNATSLQTQLVNKVSAVTDDAFLITTSEGARAELKELQALYSSPKGLGQLQSNLQQIEKSSQTTAGQKAMAQIQRTLGLSLADLRRTWVSGQLGGKYLPNVAYQVENLVTAPIIASVAAPGTMTVILKGVATPKAITFAPRIAARATDPAYVNQIVPGTRYTYGQVRNAMATYNLGSTQAGLNMGDVALADLARELEIAARMPGSGIAKEAQRELVRAAEDITRNIGVKQSVTSPWMRMALEVDMMWREQAFLAAIADGRTFDEAADLAKNAFFDYGAMPSIAKQDYARALLYLSFTYQSGKATLKALGNPNGMANLARLARIHDVVATRFGAKQYQGDAALQALWVGNNGADGDNSAVNLYMRDPYMGQLMTMGNALTFITQGIQGDPEITATRGLQGVADYFYIPFLDILQDLDPDYKKGVPPKTMYQILLAQQAAGMISDDWAKGAGEIFIDRYDLEVRPTAKMIPGQPTYNNFQYRFRTPEGYNNFLLDTQIATAVGAKRLGDDIVGALIAAEIVPPGTEYGYLENGSPVLYIVGRERPVPVPSDWAMKDALLRKQQQRIRELNKSFGEDPAMKAGEKKK